MTEMKVKAPAAIWSIADGGMGNCPARKVHLQDSIRRPMGKRLVVTAEGPNGRFTVRGQTAKALLALAKAGASGVSAFEVSSWAFRFSAYCFELRHRHGLAIATEREAHEGGWHGRHVLLTPVRILGRKP